LCRRFGSPPESRCNRPARSRCVLGHEPAVCRADALPANAKGRENVQRSTSNAQCRTQNLHSALPSALPKITAVDPSSAWQALVRLHSLHV
jgi:hypothetical protein